MLFFIVRWIISALLLILTSYIIPGLMVANFWTALIAAIILGLINAIIRPILIVLTLPVNILTLGLFTLVINGLLFWLAASFLKGFTVTGFWPAFFAALVYGLLTIFVNHLLAEKKIK